MIICINYLAKMNCLTDGDCMLYLWKVLRRILLMSNLQLVALEKKWKGKKQTTLWLGPQITIHGFCCKGYKALSELWWGSAWQNKHIHATFFSFEIADENIVIKIKIESLAMIAIQAWGNRYKEYEIKQTGLLQFLSKPNQEMSMRNIWSNRV